jgi:hypothetical protein
LADFPFQHLVEQADILVQRVAELSLRCLEAHLELLVHGKVLIRRFEVTMPILYCDGWLSSGFPATAW